MKPVTRVIVTGPLYTGAKLKALWCWQAEQVANADYVIDFCLRHYINLFLIPYSKSYTVAQWRYFIGKCADNGIPVHALHGDPLWGTAGYQAAGLTKIEDVHAYNQQVTARERFTGMHYDVEPYSLAAWDTTSTRTEVIMSWLANMQTFADRSRGYGMAFAGAFPFWLDSSADVADATPPEYTKPVYQMFMDMVDEYAVMSYRDNAAGMIETAQGEADYAESPKVVVSAELTQQTPPSITFFEEGVLALESALTEAHAHYDEVPGYAGVAIHDYRAYELFRQRYKPKTPKRQLAPRRSVAPR